MFGNSCAHRRRLRALVLLAAAEPAVLGRSPVRQQQRSRRIEVAGQEPGQGRRHVPGAGREIEDRREAVRLRQPLVQHRHAGCRGSGVLVDHEGVPGGQQRARESGHHHGVVDVGDDAEPLLVTDHEHVGGHRIRALGAHRDRVPPRLHLLLDHDIHDTAVVGPNSVPDPVQHEVDLAVLDRHGDEGPPAACAGRDHRGRSPRAGRERPGRAPAPSATSRSRCTR